MMCHILIVPYTCATLLISISRYALTCVTVDLVVTRAVVFTRDAKTLVNVCNKTNKMAYV